MVVVRCWFGGISPSLENAPVIKLVQRDFDRLAFVFSSIEREFGWFRSHPTSDTKLTTGNLVSVKTLQGHEEARRSCVVTKNQGQLSEDNKCMRMGMRGRSSQ